MLLLNVIIGSGSCMTEDREADSHCYRFYDTPESWMQAESICQSWGSHLIAVQNEAKQVGTGA